MAEVLGAVSACISILAFAVQIGGRIESLRELRKFTPAEVARELEHISSRLESFHTHLLRLQALKNHNNHSDIEQAVELCANRFRVVEEILQELQRKFIPEANTRLGLRTRAKLCIGRDHVEKQIKNAQDIINGMSHEIER
jgi:hypothetical protein